MKSTLFEGIDVTWKRLPGGDEIGALLARAAAEYRTRLFVVCWEDGEAERRALDGRVPYLELGSL